jgi:hypothetical protein
MSHRKRQRRRADKVRNLAPIGAKSPKSDTSTIVKVSEPAGSTIVKPEPATSSTIVKDVNDGLDVPEFLQRKPRSWQARKTGNSTIVEKPHLRPLPEGGTIVPAKHGQAPN